MTAVHVTRVSQNHDVFGHTTDRCDAQGCASQDLFWFSDIDGRRVKKGDVVKIPDGAAAFNCGPLLDEGAR